MRKGFACLALAALVALGGMTVSALAAGLERYEKTFVKDQTSAAAMQVELGKVAQQKAASQAVKDFGKQMEDDHGKAGEEMKAIAVKNNLKPPAQLELRHKFELDKLAKLSGNEFDKKYMDAMVKDHKKDLSRFKKASKKVKDPDLKAFVDKTLPTLEQHLAMAKETAQKVGVKVK